MAKKKNQNEVVLNVSDERIMALLQSIDDIFRQEHTTTLEMLVAARQMTTAATAQLIEDNPQADRLQIIDDVCRNLRQELLRRIMPQVPGFTQGKA